MSMKVKDTKAKPPIKKAVKAPCIFMTYSGQNVQSKNAIPFGIPNDEIVFDRAGITGAAAARCQIRCRTYV